MSDQVFLPALYGINAYLDELLKPLPIDAEAKHLAFYCAQLPQDAALSLRLFVDDEDFAFQHHRGPPETFPDHVEPFPHRVSWVP
jgi:hypothetical protein